eukprot:TRINITY_DN23_c8_g1_i1.p1 TRINITY_DN23_c8_g1~~TRINITY_DN23_c8_g1_i1.p1  ORF type:complete len:1057 (+),score=252.90 TRINITY_DN23_c8_g1_i1:125-3295(+)
MSGAAHIEDIGRLLLDATNVLKGINVDDNSELKENIAKLESDFRNKAAAVLSSVVSGEARALPLHQPSTYGQQQLYQQPQHHHRIGHYNHQNNSDSYIDHMLSTKRARKSSISNSTQKLRTTGASLRSVGGAIVKRRVTEGKPLPRMNRLMPNAPPPPVTQDDVKKGVFDMVNRRLIPPSADLTPAFTAGMPALSQSRVRFHDQRELQIKTLPFSSANQGPVVRLDPVDNPTKPIRHSARSTRASLPKSQLQLASTTLELQPPPDHKINNHRPILGVETPQSTQRANSGRPNNNNNNNNNNIKNNNKQDKEESVVREAVDKIRGFNELLDTYSLHQFIIRNAKTITNTPEFMSFHRRHGSIWGPIMTILKALEELLAIYAVPLAYIDGKQVALLATDDLSAPTFDQLLSCITNVDQVAPLLHIPGQRFRGPNGRKLAAIAIQSVFRMYNAKSKFGKLKAHTIAINLIARAWKAYIDRTKCREQLRQKRKDEEARWRGLQDTLKERWSTIQNERRVIVHVPSYTISENQRLSMPVLRNRENAQMSRMCELLDENTEIIYIVPYHLSQDVATYHKKLMQVGAGARGASAFRIIVPENLHRFPASLCLSQVFRMSPRAIRRVKRAVTGKNAYLVPGLIGPEDKKLALTLDIPLLGADPEISTLYSSKSGSKRVFAMAEINTPPGAHDIYDDEELYQALGSLIVAHPYVDKWMLKLDNEIDGRGNAIFDATGLKIVKILRTQRASSSNAQWLRPDVQLDARGKVLPLLKKYFLRLLTVSHLEAHSSCTEFIKAISRQGCVIEAMPDNSRGVVSLDLFISPNGNIDLRSSHDLFCNPYGQTLVSRFPQTLLPGPAAEGAALAVGEVLYRENIIGYASIDVIVFYDERAKDLRTWAIDLNLRLTDHAASFTFFDFLIKGKFNSTTGIYSISNDSVPQEGPRERGYMSIPFLCYSPISQVQHSTFFNICRLNGISFDLFEKTGSVFSLNDSLLSGTLGVMSLGPSPYICIDLLWRCLQFLRTKVPATDDNLNDNFQHIRQLMKPIYREMVISTREMKSNNGQL